MVTQTTIMAPAGFVPEQAVAFRAQDGNSTLVDAENPLPTAVTLGAASTPPLAGSANAAGLVGPFAPQLGRPIWLTLSGSWTGSAQLLRSTDGGATQLPLTYGDGTAKPSWSGNMQAAVSEETVAGATYYLSITPVSGSVVYRLEQ